MSKPFATLLSFCCLSAIAGQNQLEGAWGNDLGGYEIAVRNDRACGRWHYVATGRNYEGYFVGAIADGTLRINRVCGTSGGDTSKWCPSQLTGSAPEETGWDAPRKPETAQVCHGRLVFYEKDEATGQRCKPDTTIGYPRPAPREQQKRMKELASGIDADPNLVECKMASKKLAE